ncbi:ccr4 associated factor [Vermiconidia calcicola]|uniref:Ccr4 associated factor n=1 Tax=Vermiconidia calcicola TaxID=1690605 RepID=A0ACC3MX86_9PEZI|nr:ccr4 associated factor [Vermiconidia calcicola]
MLAAHLPGRTPYICARCLRLSRLRHYSTQNTKLPPPPPASGAAKLTNRRLISLHGQDAPKFLQGIVTANVTPGTRSGLFTAFLNAQGRVLSDTFIYPTLGSQWHQEINKDDEQGYLVEVDSTQAETLTKHLKRHKLRSKFKLRLLEEGELDVWSVWKEDERWTAHTAEDNAGGIIMMTDRRAPGMGQRALLSPSNFSSDLKGVLDQAQEALFDAYTIRRYLKGVPEGQVEIPRDDSLPMNCDIDIMGGIDFRKGCYVGQELTIRTYHTGVVRRRILPVVLYEHGKQPPERLEYDPEASVALPAYDVDIRRDDERQRATGKFIAGIGNVGLAMCRVEQMSHLVVSGEGSSFSYADTFFVKAEDGQKYGIKAFVPDWIRGHIREPKIQKRVG